MLMLQHVNILWINGKLFPDILCSYVPCMNGVAVLFKPFCFKLFRSILSSICAGSQFLVGYFLNALFPWFTLILLLKFYKSFCLNLKIFLFNFHILLGPLSRFFFRTILLPFLHRNSVTPIIVRLVPDIWPVLVYFCLDKKKYKWIFLTCFFS
jgi:hypothetical protein